MTIQLSITARNALLDAIESATGASAVLKLRTGAKPADCAAADSGTVIATLDLPVVWMAPAVNGTKLLSGTWQDIGAEADGTVGHFRLYATDGTTCFIQGSVTATGDGGDMTLDNVVVVIGQPVTITGFTLIAPNA